LIVSIKVLKSLSKIINVAIYSRRKSFIIEFRSKFRGKFQKMIIVFQKLYEKDPFTDPEQRQSPFVARPWLPWGCVILLSAFRSNFRKTRPLRPEI